MSYFSNILLKYESLHFCLKFYVSMNTDFCFGIKLNIKEKRNFRKQFLSFFLRFPNKVSYSYSTVYGSADVLRYPDPAKWHNRPDPDPPQTAFHFNFFKIGQPNFVLLKLMVAVLLMCLQSCTPAYPGCGMEPIRKYSFLRNLW